MNISWEWLEKLVDLKEINIKSVIKRLTLAGFEVENIIDLPNHNKFLEISSTTNRSDTLSMMGIAKEISAITNKELKNNCNQYPLHLSNKPLEVCKDIPKSLLQTKIINLESSLTPLWLQSILENHEIQIKNNLIDILHFIEIKWAKKFRIQKISSLTAKDSTTREAFCLYYTYPDSNFKYTQNQIHQVNLLTAYSECLLLITNIYHGIIGTTYYIGSNNTFNKPVCLTNQELIETLGPFSYLHRPSVNYSILMKESIRILTRLDFIIKQNYTDFAIMVPLDRVNDVFRQIDIIEEISRIYGFDKFLDRVPSSNSKGRKSSTTYRLGHIKSVLRAQGYHESIHPPLADNLVNTITIYNPLIGEFNNLKGSLLNTLLKVNISNIKNGNGPVNLFETGRVFTRNDGYKELIHIACIFGGDVENRRTWSENQLNLNWFQAKGQMEEFFERLNVEIRWSKPSKNLNFNKNTDFLFHPNECAVLTANSQSIGIFGCLKPNLYQSKSLRIQLYGFELLIDELIIPLCSTKIFTAYSKYPSIVRDITATFDANIAVSTIINTILNYNNAIIESVKLFNLYEVQQEKTKSRNLSFRITYRSTNKTLTNSIIDELECKLKATLRTKFKINL